MITRALLRNLRNDLPMAVTLRQLGEQAPFSKSIEGRLRFVCPHCEELQAAVNPRNNLAHCFHCGKNINNIDLLMLLGYDFRAAVETLQRWLLLFQHQSARHRQALAGIFPSDGATSGKSGAIGAILRQEFGKKPR